MRYTDLRPSLIYSAAHASEWLLIAEELQLANVEWRVLDKFENLTDHPASATDVLAAVREWDAVHDTLTCQEHPRTDCSQVAYPDPYDELDVPCPCGTCTAYRAFAELRRMVREAPKGETE